MAWGALSELSIIEKYSLSFTFRKKNLSVLWNFLHQVKQKTLTVKKI